MMIDIMLFKTEEERLCQKYTALMEKAFKTALFDKEKSDKINARAKKILEQLKRKNYKGIDK
ncbi:Lacal_2735 family protein [Gillisia sp. JM1]|jgi:Txe/YoeB family toxin of Txe-Axe toxin-antitoxin module|uniref:Lacal_2735 family protein n=1 Tax=Gillisia sp. JM1 TaxID=1283286 RepID=UPI001E419A5F|nr:Lacal_2735 family protein [Gillisia sp. JM1]